jgi:hypothetical protein
MLLIACFTYDSLKLMAVMPGEASTDTSAVASEPAPTAAPPPMARPRAGKVKGAPGYGRPAPERVDGVESHRPEQCAGCGARLAGRIGQAYTGYGEVDWVREGSGWTVRIPKRLDEECLCSAVMEPARSRHGGRRTASRSAVSG